MFYTSATPHSNKEREMSDTVKQGLSLALWSLAFLALTVAGVDFFGSENAFVSATFGAVYVFIAFLVVSNHAEPFPWFRLFSVGVYLTVVTVLYGSDTGIHAAIGALIGFFVALVIDRLPKKTL